MIYLTGLEFDNHLVDSCGFGFRIDVFYYLGKFGNTKSVKSSTFQVCYYNMDQLDKIDQPKAYYN